jgi:hypothetical protein
MKSTVKFVTPACVMCGEMSIVELDEDSFTSWRSGEYAQDAFPHMSQEEREVLISGTHPACWKLLFAGSDED